MYIIELYLAHVGSREPMVGVQYVKGAVLLEGVVVRWVEDDHNDDHDDDYDDRDHDGDDDYDDDHDGDDDVHLSRGGLDCP